jgi:hypothetical protein
VHAWQWCNYQYRWICFCGASRPKNFGQIMI